MRLFLVQPEGISDNRAIVDIDEAVLRHERYIRSLSPINRDGRCLVTLEDLSGTLGNPPQNDSPIVFIRKDPPKGGLEVLDELRRRTTSVHCTNAAYSATFERITKGILRGLDWSNVLLAGGMALTTLLHTDSSRDHELAITDPDLDIYIYGLGPEDANRKAQEIHDTWVRNLPPTADRRLVVKNAKTINLLTDYPNRRIQIVLKLQVSPTDVLLNFDLDACAIGFDGAQVLMLPRCARAIETGYSVFTMDLIWGHHLGSRRASQNTRMFKYANRGFGIRFLPSYARSLEEDNLGSKFFKETESSNDKNGIDAGTLSDDNSEFVPPNRKQRERKPHGREPGLKTLKRIAYLGQDYVNRYFFGTTPLAISAARYKKEVLGDNAVDMAGEEEWQRLYRQTEMENRVIEKANESFKSNGHTLDVPKIDIAAFDSEQLHRGLPDGMYLHARWWPSQGGATQGVMHILPNRVALSFFCSELSLHDSFDIYSWGC